MLAKVRNVTKRVERVLATQPLTRNSDQLLILQVWEEEGLYLNDDQKAAFLMVSNPESIRRTRQKLQEQGKYLGQPKVAKERYLRSLEMQQAMPAHNLAYVEPEDLSNQLTYDPKTNTMRMF